MRNILYILVSLFLVCACTNNIEHKAKKQLEITMKELAKDPSSMQITNIETTFLTDSICVLQFKSKGKNGFGGFTMSEYEYLYLINDSITQESIIDLDDEKSIFDEAKKYYDIIKEGANGREIEKRKESAMKLAVSLHVIFKGREVGKHSTNNNMDNW